jgi:putative exosortase-associated protein (TIGR04073 family)
MMMRKRTLSLTVLILAACLVCSAPKARAFDDGETIEEASPQVIVDGMANKFARGVTNIATGWVEIPKQIYITSKEEGAGRGVSVGCLKGIGMMVVRTVAGVGEAATFMVSYPGFYDPLFDPAYVWQKE